MAQRRGCANRRHNTNVINSFSRNGLAESLKDSKLDINNYRPISNLSVLSKAYEKCFLLRLEQELNNGEGSYQHGFRKGHSTETALLTIQGMIADVLDSGRQGIIYSVDLSAAFDLLRPDKFAELFKNKLSEGLIYAVIDFLTGRKFCVNLNASVVTRVPQLRSRRGSPKDSRAKPLCELIPNKRCSPHQPNKVETHEPSLFPNAPFDK
jgi:hypothetical protein